MTESRTGKVTFPVFAKWELRLHAPEEADPAMRYHEEADALRKAHWPKCDKLAADLTAKGPRAAEALESALTSRIHHVRSAALKGLAAVDPRRARLKARELLADRAYEVRVTAANILGVAVPD